jgi:hypothetical protein
MLVASWILPSDYDDCYPVFVAYSILAAIWLLCEMLPAALSEDSWQQLTSAAQSLSNQSATPPPLLSAQLPSVAAQREDVDSDAQRDLELDPDLVQPRKRRRLSASLQPTPKRVCNPTASPVPLDEPPSSIIPYYVVTITNNNCCSDVRI